MVTTVFVYGTLMPGHLRWELLEPHATAARPTKVDGRLFDTGRGWPAARFREPVHARPLPSSLPPTAPALSTPTEPGRPGTAPAPDPGDPSVPGWVVAVEPTRLAEALALLDEVEDAVVDHPGRPDGPGTRGHPGRVVGSYEYRRVVVRSVDGHEAWAYEALRVLPHWTPIGTWEGRPER